MGIELLLLYTLLTLLTPFTYTALLAYAVFIVAFSSYIYLLLLKLYGNMALWVLDYIRIKSYNWLLLSVSHFPEVGSGHRFRIFS